MLGVKRSEAREAGKAEVDGAAGEPAHGHETFTSRGVIPPVAPLDTRPQRPSASDLAYGGTPLRVGPTEAATQETKTPEPVLPGAHTSREIKIEFGEGTVTGGITATLEFGKTGIPLGADKIKALENTASIQLNGLKTRLESAILSGEVDGELFEGLKISIEANAIKASVDSDGEAEVDLATISVKLLGDAGHLLNAGPDVTLTVEGNLSISLGGKLAAKLASFTVAQLEQQMIVKEMDEVAGHLDDSVRKVKDLEAKADLLESRGRFDAARELRDEAFQHRLKSSTARQQLEGLTGKLKAAKARADKAIGKLQGKLAKHVAKAMEKKAIKFIATKLMKFVPILNFASTVIDIFELAAVLEHLFAGEYGGNSEEKTSKDKGESTSGSSSTQEDMQGTGSGTATKSSTPGDREGDRDGPDQKTHLEEARKTLSPAARAIVDSLTGKGAGAALDPDQIKAIGMIVPSDLTADELGEVLASLRASGVKARTPEEVIEAVTKAVHAIRNRNSTVMVNGQPRQDLAGGSAGNEEEVQGPSGGGGAVTSPSQVAGPTRPMEVVRGGDPAIIGRWFKAVDGELVWTDEGDEWQSTHLNTEIAPNTRLDSVEHTVTNAGPGKWGLQVVFRLYVGNEFRPIAHRYHVYVGGADDGFGAKVGELKFEGYIVVGRT